MKFLRDMDLYKGVILATLICLPIVGYWIKGCNNEIVLTEKAISEATSPGGYIDKIGKLFAGIELVEQNKLVMSDATKDAKVFLEGQIANSRQPPIESSNLTIKPTSEERRIGVTDKQLVIDYAMAIEFPKQAGKDFELNRATLQAILFNCESGARGANVKAQSVWKLLGLSVQNASISSLLSNHKAPPQTIEDRWIVKNLSFVRRAPKKDEKK
jgi:hypothetical protein